MKSKMKLYVWTKFCPDYTDGLAFAMAKDETEARKLVVKAYGYEPYTWGELHVHLLTKKVGYAVCGGG